MRPEEKFEILREILGDDHSAIMQIKLCFGNSELFNFYCDLYAELALKWVEHDFKKIQKQKEKLEKILDSNLDL